jgi:hypothetical protein
MCRTRLSFSFSYFSGESFGKIPKKQKQTLWERVSAHRATERNYAQKFLTVRKGGGAGKLVSRQAHDNSTGRMSWPAAFRDNGAEEGPGGRQGAGATRSRAPSPVSRPPARSAPQQSVPVPLCSAAFYSSTNCARAAAAQSQAMHIPMSSPLVTSVTSQP